MVPNYLSSLQINKLIIIEGSGIGKTNSLFNQISKQPDIEKIYVLNMKQIMKQNIHCKLIDGKVPV